MKDLKQFLNERAAGPPPNIKKLLDKLSDSEDMTTDEIQQLSAFMKTASEEDQKTYRDIWAERHRQGKSKAPRFSWPENWDRIYT
jgi:hypothetical protein